MKKYPVYYRIDNLSKIERCDINNSAYILMIRSSIRTALKLRLNYYEFNWYLLGTKNGYCCTNDLPSSKEIDYADRLIDKVSDALLKKGGV